MTRSRRKNGASAPNKSEQGRLEAMLKHSRKVMLQRQNKPLAKHASETLGVVADVTGFAPRKDDK